MTTRRICRAGSALALTMHLGLSACITADAPKTERDEEGALRLDGDEAADEAGARAKKSSQRKPVLAAADAGVQPMADDDEEEALEEAAAARDGGGEQLADDDANASQDGGMQSAMQDETQDDEDLQSQPHYCGILGTTTRVCNGSITTDYSEGCVDGATDCLALLPPDERIDYSAYCYTRIEYEVFGDGPQVGTCEQYDAYWAGAIECLRDSHCGEGERCVDDGCVCPEGADCVCPNCGPQPARCDGAVLIELVGAGPCDANRQCVYEERRTDCAAQRLACDPYGGCVEPSTPPPPPPPAPDGGIPGGPGA